MSAEEIDLTLALSASIRIAKLEQQVHVLKAENDLLRERLALMRVEKMQRLSGLPALLRVQAE